MKKKDRLYLLVKSLSKSEKRFFKIYSARHVIGEQNKYVQLFDAIDKQRKQYDEKVILKKFKAEKFIKRLPVAKAYLYELILKSMNAYYTQHNPEAQLRELLGNIHFLLQKSLYNQALKLIGKAKKLATDYEKLTFLPEILGLQKNIWELQFYAHQSEIELQNLHQETQEVFQKLDNINQYWLLNARLYYHHTHQGLVRHKSDLNKIDDIPNASIMTDEKQALSYEARLLMYKTHSTFHFINRNFPKCYHHSNKLVELLESRPELLQLDSMLYVSSINNLLNMTNMLGKNEERNRYLSKLETMVNDRQLQKNEALQLKLFQAYYYHQMTTHIGKADFKAALPLLEKLREGLEKYREKMAVMGQVMLCFYAFNISFCAEKFEAAHDWLQRILQFHESQIRQDIYCFSQILMLLVAYEKQQPVLTKKIIKSVYRFLYKKERTFKLETLVFQFLKQLTKVKTEAQLMDLFIHLRQQFLQLEKDQFEGKAFAYFDFTAWIHSKIIQKSFAEIIREGDAFTE